MKPPTVDQLRNLADRADRGPLTPDEVNRLRQGLNHLHNRRRPDIRHAQRGYKIAALRRRLTDLHRPIQHGRIAICAACNGLNRWPCPTIDALDELFPSKETAA